MSTPASAWVLLGTGAAAGAALWAWPGPLGEAAAAAGMTALLVAWGWVSLRVARRRGGLERLAWTWFSVACFASLALGVAWSAWLAVRGGAVPTLAESYLPAGADDAAIISISLLAAYAAAFVGMLALARLAGGPGRSATLVLDAAIAAGSLFFIVWSAGYRDIYAASALAPLARFLALAYPVLDSLILALAVLAVATPSPGRPRAYGWLLAGLALLTVGDTAGSYLALGDARLGALVSATAQALALGVLAAAGVAVLRGPAWAPSTAESAPIWVQILPVWPGAVALGAAVEAQREHGGLSPIQFWTALPVIFLLVARLAIAIAQNQRLNERLRRAAAAKTEQLRFVSHEIANPLSPLGIELARLRAAQPPSREWQVIDRSVGRLMQLSRDVRTLALAEGGQLVRDLAVADLGPHVEAACHSAETTAAPRGVAVACAAEPGIAARVDAERLGQVLDNLLSNAVKFTPAGGRVEASCARRGGEAVVRVADTGVGLSAEQLATLFQPFSRPHGDAPGLGLGLYLCRTIVEAMHGRLEAESDGPGKGATFTVRLPLAMAAGA